MQINLDGVEIIVYFEFIEIVDETEEYLALLGIHWEFDNKVVINLKKRTMTFESELIRLITPLDPTEGKRYIEPIMEYWDNGKIEYSCNVTTKKQYKGISTTSSERDAELGSLYDITTPREDYVNSTTDGELSWRSVFSYDVDSKYALDH